MNLCLKYNDRATNGPGPCALCDRRTSPSVGPEVFLEGTCWLVCDACVKQHAPGLLIERDAARSLQNVAGG